ncbi:hypothetical protein ACVIGB_004251 [Bradyrhizobium sp. USDA 4341]
MATSDPSQTFLETNLNSAVGLQTFIVRSNRWATMRAQIGRTRRSSREIHSLLSKIRKLPPQTMTGVLILARAVTLFEEAQRGNYDGGEQGRGLLLSRELADAVLRVAGATA